MMDFSIAIPTLNGGDRLPALFASLRQQKLPANFTWEVLIIDNNSSDNTAKIVQQAHWPSQIPLRYILEPQPGLHHARQRAVEAAQGRWIGFLDDDTRPAPGWVAAAYQFIQQHPQVGALGGQVHAQYDIAPPPGFHRIASFLAIREPGPEPFRYQPERLSLPPGAGLVVRRQAWLDCIPETLVCTSGSGEDFELSLHLHRSGWEIWYNPAMHLTHQIPAWRLERGYLIRRSQQVGDCVCPLRLVLSQLPPAADGSRTWPELATGAKNITIRLRVFAGNLKRLLRHGWQYRRVLFSDTVVTCELAFYWHGLLSTLR